jgi:large subunit ribosomal protein L18e
MKKLETRKLVASLEKKSRQDKKAFWKDLAQRIQKPTRHNITTNLTKLDTIAKSNKDKILVVPGKILSDGEITEKVTIIGVSASEKAIQKISQKGEFMFLKDFIEKGEAGKTIIVK